MFWRVNVFVNDVLSLRVVVLMFDIECLIELICEDVCDVWWLVCLVLLLNFLILFCDFFILCISLLLFVLSFKLILILFIGMLFYCWVCLK